MTVRRFVVPVTVDASGDAEVYSPVISGKLISIHYLKDDFADGVDFVITSETTGATIWAEEDVNATARRAPRAATHTTAGVAATYDVTYAVLDKITLGADRLKFVIAAGGNATSGSFHVLIDG
ncbi:hypothetical protein [Martelella soudanensis]|uniref:hypothetical protein n=1 Tax=unclassified Martelella TaxID=2629616 RepID=UPI0015DF1B9A|nr:MULTISPECIES: hypothetical protein [unclassified Martelella]